MLGSSLHTCPLTRLATLLSVALLTGCLGGGSSGGGDTEADAVAACGNTEVRNVLVGETQRGNIDLSLCFDARDGSVDAGAHLSDVVYRNDRLTFNATEVDRPRETQISVLDPDGNTQIRINLAIQNTSGRPLETRAIQLVDQAGPILALQEDRRIYDYMLDVAYLEERITWSEKQALMQEWRPESRDAHARLDRRLKETADVLEAYQSGNASESELDSVSSDAVSALPNHGEYGARRLSELASEQNSPVPDSSHGTLTYRDSTETVSRRIGNRNYGALESEEWQFDPTFTFLLAVTRKETRS